MFQNEDDERDPSKINIPSLREHLLGEGRLHREDLVWLIDRATEVFAAEPNVLRVEAPVTVCGDVHGQFYDMMKLFEVGKTQIEATNTKLEWNIQVHTYTRFSWNNSHYLRADLIQTAKL